MIHVDFVTLMKKSDFADLYKYGRLYIDASISVPYDGEIDDLPKRKDVCEKVFRRVNQFENTQMVLLVCYHKESENWEQLRIEEVDRVYALDEDARRGCTSSFGGVIKFHAAMWSKYILDLQIKNAVEVCKQGSRNVWRIWELRQDIKEYENKLGKAVEMAVEELYKDECPKGDIPFWTYLLRYERRETYPKGNPGYFLDAVNVLMNFAQKKEVVQAGEETELYFKMWECRENETYEKLKEKFVKRKALAEIVGKDFDDYLKKAFQYFWLRSNVDSEGFIDIKDVREKEEFCCVAYLLGGVLGVDGTHEYLYKKEPLKISTDYKGNANGQKQQESQRDNRLKNSDRGDVNVKALDDKDESKQRFLGSKKDEAHQKTGGRPIAGDESVNMPKVVDAAYAVEPQLDKKTQVQSRLNDENIGADLNNNVEEEEKAQQRDVVLGQSPVVEDGNENTPKVDDTDDTVGSQLNEETQVSSQLRGGSSEVDSNGDENNGVNADSKGAVQMELF